MRTKRISGGYTLIELLVVIVIIAVLVVGLTLSLQSASEAAKKSRHSSNLKQLWSTVLLYASDNQGRLPPNKAYGSGTWQNHLVRWQDNLTSAQASAMFTEAEKGGATGSLLLFNSPLNTTKGNMAFGSGGWPTATSTTEVFGRSLVSIEQPTASLALLPYYSDNKTLIGGNWQRPGGNVNDVSFDAKGLANCAFVDGSVRAVDRESIENNTYIYSYPSATQPD